MKKLLSIIVLISFVTSNVLHASFASPNAVTSRSVSSSSANIKLSDIMRDAIVYGASDKKLLQMLNFVDSYLAANTVDLEEQNELRVIQDKIINYFRVKRSLAESGTSSSGSQRLIRNTLRSAFIDTDSPELRLRQYYPSVKASDLVSPTFLYETEVYASGNKNDSSPLRISLKGIGDPGPWQEFWGLLTGDRPEIDNAEVNRVAGLYDFQATLWLKSAKNSMKTLLFYGQIYPASLYYNTSTTSIASRVCSIGKDSKSLCTHDVLSELNHTAIAYKYGQLRGLKSYSPQDVADGLCTQIKRVVESTPVYEEMGCYPQWYRTLGSQNDLGLTVNDTRYRTSVKPLSDDGFLAIEDEFVSAGSDRIESVAAEYEGQIRNSFCAQYTSELAPIKSTGIGTLLLTDSLYGLDCSIYSERNKEILSFEQVSSINRSNVKLVQAAINESVNMVLEHVDSTNQGFKDSFINSKKGKPYEDGYSLKEMVVENIKELMELNPIAAAQTLVSQPGFLPLLGIDLFEQIDSDKKAQEITDSIVRAGTYLVGGVCAILAIVAPYAGVPALAAYASLLGTTSTVLFVAGTAYSGVRSYEEYNTYVDLMNVIQSQNGDELSPYEMQAAYENAIDLAYETAINGTLISLSAAISLLAKGSRVTELGTVDDVLAFEKQGSKTPLSSTKNPNGTNPKGGYYEHPSVNKQGVKINPVEVVDDADGWWGFPGSGSSTDVMTVPRTVTSTGTNTVLLPKTSTVNLQLNQSPLMPSTSTGTAVSTSASAVNTLQLSYLPQILSMPSKDPLKIEDGLYESAPLKLYVDGETYEQNASGLYVNVNDKNVRKTEYRFVDGKMVPVTLEDKFYNIKKKTLEDYLQESKETLGDVSVEEVNEIAVPIRNALMGMSHSNVKEVRLGDKEYILKNLGGNRFAIGTVLAEIRNAEWYYSNGLGPKTVLLKHHPKSKFFFNSRAQYELLIEKVDGINIKDAILDPYNMTRWRKDRVEVMKEEIEKSLGQEFDTVEEAFVAFAKAVLNDAELMAQIQRARELLRSSFSFTDDVQFIVQPKTKDRPANFNFIDGGRNELFKTYGDYRPYSSSELDYLMSVLEDISKADPKGKLPWVMPDGGDPFKHPFMVK